jgi:hypothetical protein
MVGGRESAADFLRRSEVEIRRLNARIHETVQYRNRSAAAHEEWKKACAEFHGRYDQLAFPGGLSAMEAKLKASDPTLVDDALTFLEVRPYFFRSGYIHQRLRKKLARLPMDGAQRARYEAVQERWRRWREQSAARRNGSND